MTSQRRTYPQGVPCWVDIEKADPGDASAFYDAVLGWDFHAATARDSPSTYLIATLEGEDVAAIGSGNDGEWNTYIAVDDADEASERVTAAGGTVLVPVADAGPGGRFGGVRRPGWRGVPAVAGEAAPRCADRESAGCVELQHPAGARP